MVQSARTDVQATARDGPLSDCDRLRMSAAIGAIGAGRGDHRRYCQRWESHLCLAIEASRAATMPTKISQPSRSSILDGTGRVGGSAN